MYLKAGLCVPNEEYYDGYPQLDNGVGLFTSMESDIDYRLEELCDDEFRLENPRKITSVTGVAAYPFISRMAGKIMGQFEGLSYKVFECKNDFFGHSVTVAGLVTGQDLYNRLKDEDLGEELLIPCVMLRHEGDLFLDNMSIDELSDRLGVKITTVSNDGFEFVDKVLGL